MKRNGGLFCLFTSWLLLFAAIATTTTDARQRRNWLKSQQIESTDGNETPRRSDDICKGWWCGQGRECKPGSDSLPDCVCREECPPSMEVKSRPPQAKEPPLEPFDFQWDSSYYSSDENIGPVCGSDGIIYPSECELHRTGCLTFNPYLSVDNSPNGCQHPVPKTPMEDSPMEHDDTDIPHDTQPSGESEGGKTSDEDFSPEEEEEEEDYSSLKDFSSFKFRKFGKPKSFLRKGTSTSSPKMMSISNQKTKTKEATTRTTTTSRSIKTSTTGQSSHSRTRASKIKRGSSLCNAEEYEILKEALVDFSNNHLMTKDKENEQSFSLDLDEQRLNEFQVNKAYLLSLMFAHFDHDHNGHLDYAELQKIGLEEKLGKRALHCHPVDFLRFDDTNHDSFLTPDEFYSAFNKLHTDKNVLKGEKAKVKEVNQLTVKVGQSVEIRCTLDDVPNSEVIWTRYGLQLSDQATADKLSIFPQGILLITGVDLLHAGNYTCHRKINERLLHAQHFHLSVQTEPEVHVRPHMVVWEKPGDDVELECRVRGEPQPKVTWLKNEAALATEEMRDKYHVKGDSITLKVQDINVSDTGAYMCQGQNEAGTRIDIASLVVMDEQSLPRKNEINETQFLLFHSRGISAYDPSNCRLQHQILSTDIIPGTEKDYVCGSSMCEWGRAVKVSSSYVYVSQPTLHQVLVISISQMVVVDVISTESFPVGLHYVPHFDQIWIECWRGGLEDAGKYLQVIRNAKEKRKHKAFHPKSLNLDSPVQNVFLPKNLPTSSQFSFAYITHQNTRGLYKVDLRTLRYVKSIDLSAYNCLPQSVHFSSLYGFIILECKEPVLGTPTGQLVLDALSDGLVEYKKYFHGHSFLSPDSRKLVTLVHQKHGTTIILQLVNENGLEFGFDVNTSLNISDVAFFSSQSFHSYDLYASAVDKENVLFLNLHSGMVELVPGVGRSPENEFWSRPTRLIESQDIFGKYVVSPSREATFVLNGQSHTVNCEVGGVRGSSLIVWL